jgi:hypothetical protein
MTGDGAVAQETHSRRPTTVTLDGDCGLQSRLRTGSPLVQYGSRLAPGHVGPGPLASRRVTAPMLALWGR